MFSTVAVLVSIPTSSGRGGIYPHLYAFDFAHSAKCEMISHCASDLHLPDDQLILINLCMSLSAICLPSMEKCLFLSPVHCFPVFGWRLKCLFHLSNSTFPSSSNHCHVFSRVLPGFLNRPLRYLTIFRSFHVSHCCQSHAERTQWPKLFQVWYLSMTSQCPHDNVSDHGQQTCKVRHYQDSAHSRILSSSPIQFLAVSIKWPQLRQHFRLQTCLHRLTSALTRDPPSLPPSTPLMLQFQLTGHSLWLLTSLVKKPR